MSDKTIKVLLAKKKIDVHGRGSKLIARELRDAGMEVVYFRFGTVDDIVNAGLSSTPYQQTDDTSARVAGQFWHTHILCNPFYVAYFTRPRKDRLTVLEVLQNTNDLRFRFGEETLHLLQTALSFPLRFLKLRYATPETSSGIVNSMVLNWSFKSVLVPLC